jgi:hypothetical protein
VPVDKEIVRKRVDDVRWTIGERGGSLLRSSRS